jgi:hypothetical protein
MQRGFRRRRHRHGFLFSPCFRHAVGLCRSAVSKLLPPIVVNGVRYRVLRLEGGGGLRFLLRSDGGDLFGVYGRNAQTVLSAAPLELKLTTGNPFRGVDFFETADGGLLVRG